VIEPGDDEMHSQKGRNRSQELAKLRRLMEAKVNCRKSNLVQAD
jgi:hypothetical protein